MSIELNQIDHREFQLGQIDIKEYDINADRIIKLPLDRPKQEVTINPSTESQVITPELGKEISKVVVNSVDSTIDSNIISRNIKFGISILGVEGDLQPDKPDQVKSVVPTKEIQEVVADSGYELAKTVVEPIPDNFIEPSGILDITDNGNYNVKEYANVAVNVGGENKFAKLVGGGKFEVNAIDLDGIFRVLNYSFYQKSGLTSIEFPNTLVEIQGNAFNACSGMTSVIFNEGLTTIRNSAFAGCSKLEKIELPSTLTILENYAFYFCSKAKKIIFKGQVPNILNATFNGCNSVEVYDFRNCTTVPTLYSTSSLGHTSGCQIVIPDGLYDEWTTANIWSSLTGVVWVKASEYVEE